MDDKGGCPKGRGVFHFIVVVILIIILTLPYYNPIPYLLLQVSNKLLLHLKFYIS